MINMKATWHANNLERFLFFILPVTADKVECCATRLFLGLDQLCSTARYAGSCTLEDTEALPSWSAVLLWSVGGWYMVCLCSVTVLLPTSTLFTLTFSYSLVTDRPIAALLVFV